MTAKRENQYRQLGLTIAYYRKLHGITQMQLAEDVNLSRTHISNIEAPNVRTSISLDKLLRHCGCTAGSRKTSFRIPGGSIAFFDCTKPIIQLVLKPGFKRLRLLKRKRRINVMNLCHLSFFF